MLEMARWTSPPGRAAIPRRMTAPRLLATTAAALLAATALTAVPALAQGGGLAGCDPDGPTPSFTSAANEVYYGCGSIFRSNPPQYFSAIGRFRNAAMAEPGNAVAHFLLGAAQLGYGQADSARIALRRALALDPTVMQRLAPRLAERPELRTRIEALLGAGPAASAPQPAQPGATGAAGAAGAPAAVPTGPATAPPRPAALFQVGDAVEVRASGSDWERGVVVRVEDDRGDGSLYLYQVRRELVPGDRSTATTSRIWPNDIRAARGAPAGRPAPAPAAPTALVLGTYACDADYWAGPPSARQRVPNPKGALLLRADGTYRYLDNGANGRYEYAPSTGAIRWVSGPLAAMRPERATFRRNVRTAQIDITQRGDHAWSCGINLP
jgi:hypothetical protein